MEYDFPFGNSWTEKHDCLLDVLLLPEIFRWNYPKNGAPFIFQPVCNVIAKQSRFIVAWSYDLYLVSPPPPI